MSDDEGPQPPTAAAPTAPTAPVRMSVRPPPKFSASADLQLWLLRFELYVREANISAAQRVKELLPLLEDEPFRVVNQQGLVGSENYDAVKACLLQRFAPDGSELEWQFLLQNRTQKQSEKLSEFAGELRVLVAKAYPNWPDDQRNDLVRNQFIRGVRSSSVQLQLMREMPATLDAALESARKLEIVEESQKRLQRSRQQAELCSIAIDDTSSEDVLQANATQSRRPPAGPRDTSVQELAAQVRKLTEELAALRSEQQKVSPRPPGRRTSGWRGKCWNCGMPGHLRRNCPEPPQQPADSQGQQPLNYRGPVGEVNHRPSQ